MHTFVKAARQPQGAPGSRQRGSTMIEVMIAILVLALGMMGMLGMFINSLKISSGAIYRNTATQHAYMMADFIRSSQANIQNYFAPSATATASCFTSAGCPSLIPVSSSTLMPNTEYKVWETQLGNLLPAGQGKVCRDGTAASKAAAGYTMSTFMACSGSGAVVVKVCWDESRIQSGNNSINNSDKTSANSTFVAGSAQCIYTAL